MQDTRMAVVGAIAKYTPDDIRLYVNSLLKSGFNGKKVMLVYDVPAETITYLQDNGWLVYQGNLKQHVIIQRFYDIAQLLPSLEVDYVVWTDVRDVIFQKNVFEWATTAEFPNLAAMHEGIRLKDEEWAVINCGTTFPEEWDSINKNPSICTGIMAGTVPYIASIFKEMYRWSIYTSNPQQLADQAALNVLASFPYIKHVLKIDAMLGIHMGVIWNKRYTHTKYFITDVPTVDSTGIVKLKSGNIPAVVHQYDRDPILKRVMEKLYA